tara:strand:- start:10403 stop:10975 length:573 start_codon:yes stop_codon:yes gene_type:complete
MTRFLLFTATLLSLSFTSHAAVTPPLSAPAKALMVLIDQQDTPDMKSAYLHLGRVYIAMGHYPHEDVVMPGHYAELLQRALSEAESCALMISNDINVVTEIKSLTGTYLSRSERIDEQEEEVFARRFLNSKRYVWTSDKRNHDIMLSGCLSESPLPAMKKAINEHPDMPQVREDSYQMGRYSVKDGAPHA